MSEIEVHETDYRRVLPLYGAPYQPAQIRYLDHGGGFSGVHLWRLDAPAGTFCLRATDAATVDVDRLFGLHALLKHVHACGVRQVAVPVPTSNALTAVEAEGRIWQLEPWMPGTAAAAPGEERLRAAMICLAEWHRAAATFQATEKWQAWFFRAARQPSPGIGERMEQIGRWDEGTCEIIRTRLAEIAWPEFRPTGLRILQLFRQLAPAIAGELYLARGVPVALQPCLRDVWSDHILFTGNEVTGLIDAHACRSDNVATDLARLLGSFVGDDRKARDAGIEAYSSIRSLTIYDRVLLESFDRSGVLLNGMTWLDWICLRGRQFTQRERVMTRLDAILKRLEQLARPPHNHPSSLTT